MVDVADVSEPKRDSGQTERYREDDDGNQPTEGQHGIEGPICQSDLPTNLKMQSERSAKYPHHSCQSTKQDKGSTDSTRAARRHVVRCDLVVTLFRLGGQGDDEAELW